MLSPREIKGLLDQLWGMGCLFIELTGGEPLLYPAFNEIVGYARNLGFAVAITTNGFLLDNKRIEELSELGVYSVIISLHSVRDTMYGKMFGGCRLACCG